VNTSFKILTSTHFIVIFPAHRTNNLWNSCNIIKYGRSDHIRRSGMLLASHIRPGYPEYSAEMVTIIFSYQVSDKVKLQVEDIGVRILLPSEVKVRQVVSTTGRTWPFCHSIRDH
jgi:hypothetical protein